MNSYDRIYKLLTEEKPKPLTTADMHRKYARLRFQGKAGPAAAAAYNAGTYDPNKDYSAENRKLGSAILTKDDLIKQGLLNSNILNKK
tara:strand:- start:249 stop:512 length:264 start_codon:yes stop_codon:yes gene_type:complete